MYETANVYPVLRAVGPDGTIEPGREDDDARFGLTALGEALLANRRARRPEAALRPPSPRRPPDSH